MHHQFWSKSTQRLENPTLKSKYITNLLSHQPVNLKAEPNRAIKIYQRPPDFIRRSYSEVTKLAPVPGAEGSSPSPDKFLKGESSRMSSFGSSSLSRLPRLQSDIDVYQKQRKDREVDIITNVQRPYKDMIKVFPKYRFQTLDQDYWRRKSFIEGMPSHALNHYSSSQFSNNGSKIQSIRKISGSVM